MNNTEAVYKALEEVNKQSMVLLPIDFSDYSLKACEFGFNFAAINRAEVVLFHAYLPPSFSSMPIGDVINYDNHKDDDTIRKMLEKSKSEIDKLCVIIDEKINSGAWPNVKYRKVLREGVPPPRPHGLPNGLPLLPSRKASPEHPPTRQRPPRRC